jgi:photosystem II stability/assembly factor-like uncharacterized protein
MHRSTLLFAAAFVAGAAVTPTAAQGPDPLPEVPALYGELTFRGIGPAVTGGRIHDVEALPHDPSTIYVATASGGLWKTTNKGTTWRPIFDDQPTSTFGDLAIAPSDPAVIWAGTGEQNNRQSTSWGSGVYRSIDGGETWTHRGLTETRHIGRVVVHPRNPDIAWVAAQGNLWKPTPERGVYRTTDGGRSWAKVLYVDTLTGGTDLAMDACDPDRLYAATYQRLRRAWGFNGGGSGSGIWRSADGGETWERLTGGLPAGDKGRIGLAAAADACGVATAIVQHADSGGVYRTEDGGESWERMSSRNIRPMYYSHIYLDPTNADRVYTLATRSARSEDGGRTWTDVSGRLTYDVGVHSDHHAMWIDPADSRHYYLVGDAGLYETWDRGETYMRIDNLPIAQLYALGVDTRDPYNVYIGLQDNHSWMGPSATRHWAGIVEGDWRQIGFGDGMYHRADPTNPRVVYSNSQNGGYIRLDTETGDRLDIAPTEPEGEDYRWDWVSPSLVSAHDPSTVYVGGNRLFISRDRGETWERTGDLTRATDRDTLQLMGVPGDEITLSRNDGTSSYGEITTIAESPLDPEILWVGADDGRLQVSTDGGDSWTPVDGNVPGLPDASPDGPYVSRVVASRADRATAWATFDAHRDGDFAPYVYRTTDMGRSWTPRTAGLEGAGSVNVIAEHPASPAVVFLGTEHALWVSTDAGARWQRLGANLPTTLFDDLVIHPETGDLVVGTHGRSVWILDDAAPLGHLPRAGAVELFPARDATLRLYWKDTSYRGQGEWDGPNPPAALFSYLLAEPADAARLVITREGETIRRFDVSGEAGVIHRVPWNLRYAPLEGDDTARDPRLARPTGPRGPLVAPGTYTVTLEVEGATSSRTFAVHGDPELPMLSHDDYRAREAFLLEIRELRRAIAEAREADAESASELDRLDRRARRLERALIGGGVQQGTLHPPTPPQRAELAEIRAALDAQR